MPKRGNALKHLVAPLLTFGVILLAGSIFASVWKGRGGFQWMLVHGASGPLAGILLHGGKLNAGDVLVALIVVTAIAAQARYANGWTLASSLLASVVWPLIGWGAGV